MDRVKLKDDAKLDMQGRFWEAFQPFLIYIIIAFATSFLSSFSRAFVAGSNTVGSAAFLLFISIWLIILNFLKYPIKIGVFRYYIRYIFKKPVRFEDIFEDFKKGSTLWQEIIALFLTNILIAIGYICLIIPGIYLQLTYSMLPFVFAEHPEYTWREAIQRAKSLIYGHKMELLGFALSFILWVIGCVFTFGLLRIYLAPYYYISLTRYYKSLCYSKDGFQEIPKDDYEKYNKFYGNKFNQNGSDNQNGSGNYYSNYNQSNMNGRKSQYSQNTGQNNQYDSTVNKTESGADVERNKDSADFDFTSNYMMDKSNKKNEITTEIIDYSKENNNNIVDEDKNKYDKIYKSFEADSNPFDDLD